MLPSGVEEVVGALDDAEEFGGVVFELSGEESPEESALDPTEGSALESTEVSVLGSLEVGGVEPLAAQAKLGNKNPSAKHREKKDFNFFIELPHDFICPCRFYRCSSFVKIEKGEYGKSIFSKRQGLTFHYSGARWICQRIHGSG